MNKIILPYIFLFCINFANAQSSWKKIDSKNYKAKTELEYRKSNPEKFDLYSLDSDIFKEELNTNTTISIPVNGETANFSIKESSNFSRPLAPKYGYIKSFSLKGIDDKTTTGKISFDNSGVHVIIFSGKHKTIYMDPYTKDKSMYMSYKKNDLNQTNDFICSVEDIHNESKRTNNNNLSQRNANDGILRTYRLALASTIEYSNFHINNQGVTNGTDTQKQAAVLAAMNTTMTRVNGIFEKDIAITMNIVLNSNGENELIFIDSDDFSNSDAGELIDESQDVINDIIGPNNYDLGHTFSTGGGGLAALGSVCVNSQKARGITGRSSPTGDPFDIDLVAHELGHQFGANHTFNGTTGNCDDANRNNSTAVEPGSGTTIMAYAGICTVQNVQDNSDDYFHAISIEQIYNTIQSSSCETQTSTNNLPPTANAGNDFSVPKSTPLILRGEGSDSDNSSLTYCWEQIDNEIVTTPPLATNLAGASFRSFSPSISPNRYLPTLSTVLSGSLATEWEVIPSVSREMNFSLTVRDNNLNGGATERDDMTVAVIDTDPFIVTSQNTAVSWEVGTTETITWDQSTTNQSPINCENVRITLSLDGGETFPITLAESTPNDGTHDIEVPNQLTSSARIMVEGVNHIFYNINTIDFSILSSGPIFILSNISEEQQACTNDSNPITYELNVDYINGFSETVTFSIDNMPDGALATITPSSVTNNALVTIILNNLENVTTGDYFLSITGESASLSSTIDLPVLTINSSDIEEIVLSTPLNSSQSITTENLLLSWQSSSSNSLLYDLEVATDNQFSDVILFQENLTQANYTFEEFLDFDTTYYWRVRPKNNCGEGEFSAIFNFTTLGSGYCISNFITPNIDEDEFITNVTFNQINNDSENDNIDGTDDGYQDFTSINTDVAIGVTYTISVTGDPLEFADHCYVFIDWNGDTRFDNATERYDLGNYIAEITTNSLDITVPDNAILGETRMRVVFEYFTNNTSFGEGACLSDHNSQFGETEDYSITIKEELNILTPIDELLSATDDIFNNFSLGPNPVVDENINLSFDIINLEENITLRLFDFTGRVVNTIIYQKSSTTEFNENNINIGSLQTGIYLLNIQNGNKNTTKKLIVE